MTTQNPATPAQAATPGSGESVATPPAGAPAAPTQAPGNNPAGTVVISTEQFAQLNRDAARARSFGSRVYNRKPANQPANIDPSDPNASALAEAQRGREDAEKRAMQLEVRTKVSDLLADPRFKDIPGSTKKLILDRPYMLTDAETLEDAMFDIEDKLIEISTTPTPPGQPSAPIIPAPQAHETPRIATAGAPAPVDAGIVIDTSNLRGTARSVATLKNAFAKTPLTPQ